MKTQMKHIVAAALSAGLSIGAAQAAEPFTGWGVGAGLSASSNSLDISGSTANLASTTTDANLLGSFGFAVSGNWVANVALSLNPMSTKYGTYGSAASTAEMTQHVALSVAPGYRVGTAGLVYGKLALHSATIHYTNNVGFDSTQTHRGVGLGVGYGWALSKTMELRGEYETVAFDKQNVSTTQTATPKQDSLSVSLLYKF